jgi:EAL domain-containing protein (putative c-di-GMP-specific phosphodiesterase class I)/FixJ family two-component response regulator
MNQRPIQSFTADYPAPTSTVVKIAQSHQKELSPLVLLVDDDDIIRGAYRRVLLDAGLRVITAASAENALALIQQMGASIHVIVTDVIMPGTGGVGLLQEVRRAKLEIPVVLITGSPRLETAMAAVNHGGFRYLTKPVDANQLVATINEAAELRRLARLKQDALNLVQSKKREVGLRKHLNGDLDAALQQLWVAFQPIVDVRDGSLFGYEALARSACPTLSSPDELIGAAERLGRLRDLGRRMRTLVAERAALAPAAAMIFVNLHASDLDDDELYDPRSALAHLAQRVVLEVTERNSLERVADISTKIAALRTIGYRIAIDDLGAGYAGLSSFTQLEPDFAKLDMSLVRGIDTSTCRQSIVRSMLGVCAQELNIDVVCEGVETEAERATLVRLGARLVQGFLLGRPSEHFETTAPHAAASCARYPSAVSGSS